MEKKYTHIIHSRKPAQPEHPKPDAAASSAITGTEFSFIVLVTGQDAEHNNFWAYLAVPYHKYEAYCNAEIAGEFALDDYGTVLAYGQGSQPPEKIRREMEHVYKLDENFAQHLERLHALLAEEDS